MMKLTKTPDQIGADVKPMQSYESLKRFAMTPAWTCKWKWQKLNIILSLCSCAFFLLIVVRKNRYDINKYLPNHSFSDFCPTFISIAIKANGIIETMQIAMQSYIECNSKHREKNIFSPICA